MIYIRKQHKGYYLETDSEIDPDYWEGQIGETYDDFLDGKWILLSAEQEGFHKDYPRASIEEVLDCKLKPEPERTLDEAKIEKITEIEAYDNSTDVNSFIIEVGEDEMAVWIEHSQRSNYKNSLDSAELLGLTEVHPIFNGIQLTLTVQQAKMALAQIQIYADQCYIVTETHKANVQDLETIAAVDEYQYETGYPEKLTFTL